MKTPLLVSLVLAGLVLVLPAAFAAQATFYVAPAPLGNDSANGTSLATPFATLERARQAVDAINGNMSGNIEVLLRAGTYRLSTPLALTTADGASNGHRVVWRAYGQEVPVVSGAVHVAGWVLHDAGANIWRSAQLPVGFNSRQLYVNGIRAVRARSAGGLPGHRYYSTTSSTDLYRNPAGTVWRGHFTSWTAMAGWANPSGIELVYEVEWTNPRATVQSIDLVGSETRLTMQQPGFFFVTNKAGTSVASGSFPTEIKWVENAYELLDSPGEWYLDRTGAINGTARVIYYRPRAGEDLATASVEASSLEQLVSITGDSLNAPVRGLSFENIVFRGSTWLRPGSDRGFPDAQNAVIRERYLEGANPGYNTYPRYAEFVDDAAVTLSRAVGVTFERCTFTQIGGTALLLREGCQDNLVRGCLFADISATGVQVGDDYDRSDTQNFYPTDARLVLRNNDVINNYFTGVANEYWSATAIGACYPVDMDIHHNAIANVPYSAMHIGWGWAYIGGSKQNETGSIPSSQPPPTRDVDIAYNHIDGFMQELKDGAGIYVLGETSGSANQRSFIRDNVIARQANPEYGGIYPDEGSSWWALNNNVLQDVDKWLHIWNPSVHDIVGSGNFSNTTFQRNDGTNTPVSTPTLLTQPPQSAAQAIINASGPGAAYQDIILAPPPVAFTESFANGAAGWSVLGGTWSASAGTFQQTSDTGIALALAGDPAWADYTCTVRVRNVGPGTRSMGLAVRVRDDANYYFVLYERAAGVWRLYRRVNGTNTQLGVDVPQTWSANTWKAVTLGAVGFILTLTVDGVTLLQTTDATNAHSAGRIALRTNLNGGEFDDIVVLPPTFAAADFDNLAVGSTPPGWNLSPNGGTISVQAVPSTTARSLRLAKTATNTSTMTAFLPWTARTSGTVAATVRADQTNATAYVMLLKDTGGTTAINLGFRPNGRLGINQGGTWIDTPFAYAAGQWYRLRLTFDTVNDTYDLWIDDQPLLRRQPFHTPVATLAQSGFGLFASDTGILYVDDLRITP